VTIIVYNDSVCNKIIQYSKPHMYQQYINNVQQLPPIPRSQSFQQDKFRDDDKILDLQRMQQNWENAFQYQQQSMQSFLSHEGQARRVMDDHFQFLKFAVGSLQGQIQALSQQVKDESAARKEMEHVVTVQKQEIIGLTSQLEQSNRHHDAELNSIISQSNVLAKKLAGIESSVAQRSAAIARDSEYAARHSSEIQDQVVSIKQQLENVQYEHQQAATKTESDLVVIRQEYTSNVSNVSSLSIQIEELTNKAIPAVALSIRNSLEALEHKCQEESKMQMLEIAALDTKIKKNLTVQKLMNEKLVKVVCCED
jgi:hypothetical protein